MTRKIKTSRIEYPNFRSNLEVWWSSTLSIEEMNEIVEKEYPETMNFESINLEHSTALTIPQTNSSPIIVLFSKDCNILDIHHEVVHITMEMFMGIGEIHTAENDEFFAYTSTAILQDIINVVVKKFKIPKILQVE